jgi:hypothetical protein
MKPAVWLRAAVVIFRQPLLVNPPVVSTKALPYTAVLAGGPELKSVVNVPAEAVRTALSETRRQKHDGFLISICSGKRFALSIARLCHVAK